MARVRRVSPEGEAPVDDDVEPSGGGGARGVAPVRGGEGEREGVVVKMGE